MKIKKIAAALSVAVCLGMLPGCGADEKIVGEWKSKRAEVAGESEIFTSISMEFKDNGEVVYSVEDMSEVYEWELDGDKVIVDEYEFVLEDDDTLVQEESGTKIYYEKID